MIFMIVRGTKNILIRNCFVFQIPEWFYNSIKRLKCIFGIFENININQLTALNASIEYTENKKLLDININNENTKIENIFWDDISIFFPNMRFPIVSDAIVSLGLISKFIIHLKYLSILFFRFYL